MKNLTMNPGSQKAFFDCEDRYAAYIGGVGSGKTLAGIARGIKFSQQPKPAGTLFGARGLIAAINYPVLQDVVLPQFFEVVSGTNVVKEYIKSQKKAVLSNGAEILFRSLDRPNWMRGLELSWFFIDEGRHLDRAAWNVLVGRLRQKGFKHGGWVCSTPNGMDWMWDLFHEDSPQRLDSCRWFGAPTFENAEHLPAEYIKDLEASYSGKFYEQEVLGHFIGLMQGGVFPHWDTARHMQDVPYRPDLPLHSEWDFGVADPTVVLFFQLEWKETAEYDSNGVKTGSMFQPIKRYIGALEHTDMSAAEWSAEFKSYCDTHFLGRRPDSDWGDPAGKQRNVASGTSVLDELNAHGVPVQAAPKKPNDYAVVIIDNMMADDRVLVDRSLPRLAAAFSQYHYPTNDNGDRTGNQPVHDWSSHYCDASRYGTAALLGHFPRREDVPAPSDAAPGTYGHIMQQILAPHEQWLGGPTERKIEWQPAIVGPAQEA